MGSNPFTDVEHGKWYYYDMLKLSTAGIMQGYNGMAKPENSITREEAAALIVRVFDISAMEKDPNP